MSAFIEQHQALCLTLYLLCGFIIGWFAVRDGDCESPAETWLFATVAGPIFAVGLAAMLIPIMPFVLIVKLFGIEEGGSDTHGV